MALTCHYCGNPAEFKETSDHIYQQDYGPVYQCDDGHELAYVGCHQGTARPLGTLANKETRKQRKAAHALFDPLWQGKAPGTRKRAYRALELIMGLDKKHAHIAMFDSDQCRKLIQFLTEREMPTLETILAELGNDEHVVHVTGGEAVAKEEDTPEAIVIPTGIYYDLAHEDYLNAPGYSSTFLKTVVTKSAAHAHYLRENPEDKACYRTGSALHLGLESMDAYLERVHTMPEDCRKGKGARSRAADWKLMAQANKWIVLTESEKQGVDDILSTLGSDSQLKSLIHGGKSEVSLFWDDPTTGERMKARIDLLKNFNNRHFLFDFKSCQSGEPNLLNKAIGERAMFLQSAIYLDGARALGFDNATWAWIFMEKAAPYEWRVVERKPDHPEISLGRRLYQRAIGLSKEKNGYPRLPNENQHIGMSDWMYRKYEDILGEAV